MKNTVRRDEVDGIVAAWGRERPDFDASPLAVFSRVMRLSRHLERFRRLAFATHNLESWEFEMLSALRRQGAPYQLTAGRLMQETLVSSGTVTNRIDRMIAHGLVTRHTDENDGRVVHVRATKEGIAAVDAAMADLLDKERVMLEALDGEGEEELVALLRQLLVQFE